METGLTVEEVRKAIDRAADQITRTVALVGLTLAASNLRSAGMVDDEALFYVNGIYHRWLTDLRLVDLADGGRHPGEPRTRVPVTPDSLGEE